MTSPIQTSAEAMETAALAKCAELHTDGKNHAAPLPAAVTKRAPDTKSPAEWAYQRVILYLKHFEEGLTEGEEAAMGFTGGAAGVLRIEGIGFNAPDLITFAGRDEGGRKCQQILHVSQLNILLRAIPKPEDQPEPMRIGFRLARALEEAESAAS